MFPKYAQILAALEQGDGRPFYDLLMAGSGNLTAPGCALDPMPPQEPRLESVTPDATAAILCADHPANHDTLETFNAYHRALMDLSEAAGGVNSASRLACVGRTVRPKWSFDGKLDRCGVVACSLKKYCDVQLMNP
jgi:hypothetical protein